MKFTIHNSDTRSDSMAYQYRCVDPEISLYRKTPVQ